MGLVEYVLITQLGGNKDSEGIPLEQFCPLGEIEDENTDIRNFDHRTGYELAMDVSLLDKNKKNGHTNLQVSSEMMVQRWDEWFDYFQIFFGFQYFASPKIRL